MSQFPFAQIIATCVVNMLSFTSGSALGWSSPALMELQSDITDDVASWVASILGVGALVGCIPTGLLGQMLGRKKTAMGLTIPFAIGWLVILMAGNEWMLLIGRVICGFAVGGTCVIVPIYVSEIVEIKYQGVFGFFFQLFLCLGVLFSYSVGAILSWRDLTYACMVMPLLFFVFMFFMPETPPFDIKKGRRQHAIVSYAWLWKGVDVSEHVQRLEEKLSHENDKRPNGMQLILSNRGNFKALLFSMLLMVFQQLSGINAVIFYSEKIFSSANSALEPKFCTILVGSAMLLSSFIAVAFVMCVGRKCLLIVSSFLMGFCLALLAWHFNSFDPETSSSFSKQVPLIAVLSFIVVYSLGYGPIPWMMSTELLPIEMKGFTSLAVLINWAFVFIVTKSFGILTAVLGLTAMFVIFSTICFIATIIVGIFFIETKNKTPVEIHEDLMNQKIF